MKLAIVRGKFLNRYEMQFYEPLAERFDITAFGSLRPYHDRFAFPVIKLPSPMDLPEFPLKMPLLNRLFTDAHYLYGLENALSGFDIVHTAETYYRYTQQCLDAKRQGNVKKVVVTVLENIPFNNEGIRGRKQFKKRTRDEADLLIALTRKTRDALLAEGADPEKITVLPHFIDTGRFHPSGKKKRRAGRIRILFVGRLEAYKGVYELLEAMRLMQTDHNGAAIPELQLVGSGSQKRKLEDWARANGLAEYVRFESATYDDMPDIYRNADIFVAPSKPTATWEEQYNTSLLEAQASGLPIVTTRSGGIPENVGDAALLVEPADPYGLYEALSVLQRSPAKRTSLGHKARQRALSVHDSRKGAGRLASLYHSVLQRTKPGL